MSRRIKEAILLSKELGSSDESSEGSEEDEDVQLSGLYVRYHVPLSKDFHSIYSLHFSPNGKQLAVGFGNGAIQIVNIETGALKSALYSGHRTRQAVTAMSYHPLSNKLLVAAGADGIISIFDIESTNALSFSENGNEINALDFCLDGSVYATAGKDRHIRLYDSHTNEILHILEGPDIMNNSDDLTLTSGHSRRIFALKFHPNEYHIFLTGGWDNSIKDNKVLTGSWVARNALQLWDYRSAQLEKNIPFPARLFNGEFIYAAKFCNKNVVIAGGSGTYSACAVDYKTDKILGEVSLLNKTVQTLDVTRCGKLVAVAGVGGNLHIAELC
ncbi:probable cytosolic iron-sulfur protein assembly protein CIAO1 homolog isoform X2 [Microcaecilia unicolor]|uniref:Probable cytosolic iron-sulfur protein assembly protein CIAO1 homolog isoform X2 n=1 Tax=Microcaecilia unicolor TaxID=1415580 RepID=A0A6P7XVJ3_9AMPH|nr:probable cytosolic iron-sulfur protein assembly protein CIAO1 homolog isoform X2 [Microcaecilia unicolor]